MVDGKQIAQGIAQSTPPAALFQGYDTFTASASPNTAVSGSYSTVGGAAQVRYAVCQSMSDVANALHISAELSASTIFGSIDAKTDYVQSLKLTETCILVTVYANAVAGTQASTDAQVRDGVTFTDLNDWYGAYGDSFISKLTLGAEYIATYTFYSQTREEQESLISSLRAQTGALGGDVSASLDTEIRSVANASQVRFDFDQQIFGMSGVPLPTNAELATFALSFPALDVSPGEVIEFETTGYEHLPAPWHTRFAPVVKTRDAFTGGPFGTGSLAQDLDSLIGLDNQTQWIKQIYAIYGYDGDTKLAARQRQITADRQALAGVLTTIATVDVTVVPPVPELPSLTFGNPVVTCTTPAVSATLGEFPVGVGSVPDIGYADILMGTTISAISLNGNWAKNDWWGTVPPQAGIKTVTYTRADGTSRSVAHHPPWHDPDDPGGLMYDSSDGDSIALQPQDRIAGISGSICTEWHSGAPGNPLEKWAMSISLTTSRPAISKPGGRRR